MQHLIHIGYPKAGSTFLQKWFEVHPQLQYTNYGIAGLGSADEINEFADSLRELDVRYLVTSRERLSTGFIKKYRTAFITLQDAPPSYFENSKTNQHRVCKLLHEMFPKARVLIVTRGIKSFLKSAYSERVKSGYMRVFSDYLIANKMPWIHFYFLSWPVLKPQQILLGMRSWPCCFTPRML